jgi:hypothetical protein
VGYLIERKREAERDLYRHGTHATRIRGRCQQLKRKAKRREAIRFELDDQAIGPAESRTQREADISNDRMVVPGHPRDAFLATASPHGCEYDLLRIATSRLTRGSCQMPSTANVVFGSLQACFGSSEPVMTPRHVRSAVVRDGVMLIVLRNRWGHHCNSRVQCGRREPGRTVGPTDRAGVLARKRLRYRPPLVRF